MRGREEKGEEEGEREGRKGRRGEKEVRANAPPVAA